MTLRSHDLTAIAGRLDDAQHAVHDIPSLADEVDLDIEDAYRIQADVVRRRLARGETSVGVKLGFTSKAKMTQMGVSDVIVGRLTDAMRIDDGGTVELSRFIHPKVEPEIVYRIGTDVDLDDPDTDIVACVDAIAAGMEIIDSRYRDFRFTYTDVVADNTSAAAFVVGPWSPMRPVPDAAVRLTAGDTVVTGSTASILDDPVNALHALFDMCRRHRIPLSSGDIVLAGAATAATTLHNVEIRCQIAGLEPVTVKGIP